MIDWKVLAAGVAALILVTLVAAGETGKELFSGIAERLGNFLGTSPFGGLFSSTQQEEIVISLYPDNLSLQLDGNDVNLNSLSLTAFTGSMDIDFIGGTVMLIQKNSDLRISAQLEYASVTNLKIPKLLVENTKMDVISGKYNISSSSGTIEIFNFAGNATIDNSSIQLKGNVTKAERK